MIRGEVYWADLAPLSDSEQGAHRPVIVVSNDGFNQFTGWRSIVALPVSTSPAEARQGPTAVAIPTGAAGLPRQHYRVSSGHDPRPCQVDEADRVAAALSPVACE